MPASAPEAKLGASLRNRHVTMIAIGGIIGAGLFVGSSTAIANTGPAVVISYFLAGLLILLIMRMLGEMAASWPGTRAFTDFIRIGLGDRGGFVSGWLYWYFWVVVVAVEAIAGAVILKQWLPFEVWQIGIALLGIMTVANLFSARSYGEFEFWLSSMKVAAILLFIALASLYAVGVTTPVDRALTNLTAHGGFAPAGLGTVLATVTTVIFALCGAEIATIAAAEAMEPERTIARLTASVAVRILLFYMLSIGLIVAIVPWTQIIPGYSPFATALDHIGIPYAATIMNVVVLVAVLSCLNSGLYVTSRILFTLAARGDAPRWLVAVNGRRVPVRATLIASLFGYVALAASFLSPELVFSFLVNASGAIMLIIYVMVAVAHIRMRRHLQRTAPERLTARMWLFPWLSYITIAGMLAVLAAMLLYPDLRVQLLASLLVAGLVYGAARLKHPATSGSLPLLHGPLPSC
ncbi:GABA permease [Sphingomonas oleivorans]|uniref:GABA permease n=1 Tax=Sphingomonas oleivorans TaxID=1735121 RepID=A0A2T5FZ66_9SPHN|nr:amino acid permease [Sphingomonas oleivorans]PTQ11890.1 GABA permease [Sphingomonas oleivorans]